MALGDMTKEILSGSTDGRQILVVATGTPGTLIHTADADERDEIWIWAENHDTSDRDLTIEWGGVTDPNDLTETQLPLQFTNLKEGKILIIPGWILQNGLIVRAFGSAASIITIQGYVNRIAQS